MVRSAPPASSGRFGRQPQLVRLCRPARRRPTRHLGNRQLDRSDGPTGSPGFSAAWTGIGGYNSQDLIQAGTSQDALPVTGSQYYAWYEILPAAETPITNCPGDANCTVHPGDAMTVSITLQGGSQWSISMADKGHWTWSTTLSYASTFSSAEWILEAPTLVAQTIIANVGTATFDSRNTFALDGATKTIAQGHPISIRLSPGGPVAEAIPSVLDSDGDGFNGCTYALSCALPSS